ncbi:hypothetical protein PybrP1_005693 [[Pythium] brassicae (nom. inval.)]|nr:hypothetical protein PybrP1_005693 [[Pythium] brassicae (nom. inval.)]
MTDADATGLERDADAREEAAAALELTMTTTTTTTVEVTTTTTTTALETPQQQTLPVSPLVAAKRLDAGNAREKSSVAAMEAVEGYDERDVPPPPPLDDDEQQQQQHEPLLDVRLNGFVSSSAPSAMTPLERALTASPSVSTKSDGSAASAESAQSATAIERALSGLPGVTTERPDVSDASAKPVPRSTPVLERAHTSSELHTVRAREIQSARAATDKPKGAAAATAAGAAASPAAPSSSSSVALSAEIESVSLPAKGIKETEIDKTMHTLFAIEVRLQGGLQWIIHKRYSDFRELHDRLKRTNAPVKNLAFPKRHVFRSRQQSVIEQRRSELEKYVKEVLEIRPLIRVPLFNFLEVYAHMESYERKLQRHKKELESERMKNLLRPADLDDLTDAFKRLASSKFVFHGTKDEPESSNSSSSTATAGGATATAAKPAVGSSPTSPSKDAAATATVVSSSSSSSLSPVSSKTADEQLPAGVTSGNTIVHTAGSQITISRASFRRDILGVFPEMPSSFAMRFMKAVSDRQGADINMDEFLRAIAILRCGVLDDRLKFVFFMCDLDHAGKVQSTGLSNFLVSLHGRQILERAEYRRLLSDGFDQGRARMSMEEFVKVVQELDVSAILVEWMEPFVDILCETADPQLLESQEEFNPVVQQKILANETRLSIKEVSILQEAFNNYRTAGGGDGVDLEALSSDFPLEMSDERFARVFASFGSRANGADIDIFSFVNAVAIACRGTPDEKARFAFTLFATLPGELMSRDDLYGMLRLDLAQNSELEDLVVSFIEENVKVRSNSKSLTTSGSLGEVLELEGTTPAVSGSELGIFVDHLMKKFGHARAVADSDEPTASDDAPVLVLSLEEFASCAKHESYEMGTLRIIREVAFIDLGLIPADKDEELLVARGCYKAYEPTALVEDEQWFLLDAKWFDHWCKYINLQLNEALPVAVAAVATGAASSSTQTSTSTAKNGASATGGSAARDKEPPIVDADGNYLRPKCLNNYTLLTSERRERVLKPEDEIKLGKHFVVVGEQLWMALKLWYGGGPEIRRTVVMPASGVPVLDIWENALKKNKKSGDEDDDDDSASPSDDEKRSKKQALALPRRMRAGGSVGLSNLGNTCYMNSALQCLSNTQLLAEYFLSGMYLDDINRTSTLGLQGKLAEVFGKLAEDMWCSKQKSISPRNFKKSIGKFNEAFRGSEQQDSQELLAFLLSGLSEDLNRITEKPYVDQPDSDGRYDADLADEWWRNHLRREVSIIVALFTGQYKSLLTCSVCGFKSARFEPFTFLQVPLPEPTHNTVTVLLVLANGMTPTKVSVRLTISATIYDLKHALMNLCHDEFSLPQVSEADIKLCEFSGSMILSFKADSRRIGQIRSIDRLIAFQLEPLDADVAMATRHRRPSYIPTGPGASRAEEMELERNAKFFDQMAKGTLIEVRMRAQSHDFVPGVVVDCPAKPSENGDEEPQVLVRLRRSDDEIKVSLNRLRPRQARLLYVPLVSRKLSYSAVYYKNPFRPMPFGIPNLVRICPERTTGLDLYTMIWERVKDYVKAPRPKAWDAAELANKNALVSNHIDDIFSGLTSSSGFLLRRVENKGLTDARSPWLTRSFGHTIPCTDELLDILEEETIAIDWDLQVFQDRVLIDRMKHVEAHASVAKNEAIDKGPVPLKHCLDSFTSEEKISEGYCSSCREHVEMTKKLEIWRLPPIMVVHLKRFQYTQTYRRKLGSLVEFPIEGLDLSCCVAPHEEFPAKYPMKKVKEEPAAPKVVAVAEAPTEEKTKATQEKKDRSTSNVETATECAKLESAKPSVTFAKSASSVTATSTSASASAAAAKANVVNRVRRGYTNTNLDQSRCLETNYDLYGVVNHQGALGGGHYTAYAKNFLDDQWYYYDDERVRVVEESRVVSPSAYLLFYLRSDLKGVEVKDMYPQTKSSITDEDIDRFVDQGDERRCQIM